MMIVALLFESKGVHRPQIQECISGVWDIMSQREKTIKSAQMKSSVLKTHLGVDPIAYWQEQGVHPKQKNAWYVY